MKTTAKRSTRRCESTLQGARITLAKNVLPRATRHVPLCVYSFCIAHDGLNVPRKFHEVFVTSFSFRSRKQCRANRCQLRHSGFWLSSQIIAGGNRCLPNKLRMNRFWERTFWCPRKDRVTCTFECPMWQLLLGKVPFFFCYLHVKWHYFLANLDGTPILKKINWYKIS